MIIYKYDKHMSCWLAKITSKFVVFKISSGVWFQIKSKLHVFLLYCSPAPISGYTRHIYYIGINNHNPTEGIPTLTQWWGLCGQMILRSMLVVA
jgi:hypothetical protein